MAVYNCLSYAEQLSAIVADTTRKYDCNCILLSGGIDTSFVALSLSFSDISFHAVTVVLSKNSIDERYSKILSKRLKFDHEIVYASDDDVERCLSVVLNVFRTIDPIEVVCDLPICIGLEYALNHGCTCVLTGDGGDELFLGYDFLLNSSIKDVKVWLNNVMHIRYFPAEKIGEYIGLRVIPALFTREVRDFSRKVPLECRINNYNNVMWGKFLLRMFLDKHGFKEIAWRKKTPINMGSGSNYLLHEWSKNVNLVEVIQLSRGSGILFPSRVHAYLYKKLLEYNIKPPNKCRDPSNLCPICGRCMSRGHCSFCGASLNKGFKINVYSDDILDVLKELFRCIE